MDLFAYDRSTEESLAEMAEDAEGKDAGASGANPRAAGDGKGGSGRRGHQDSLRKSGTLRQVMSRLQLQSHINQVRFKCQGQEQDSSGWVRGRAWCILH